MKLYLAIIVAVFILFSWHEQVNGACCAWDDRTACASCPEGYFSGCKTNGNICNCDCAKSESELAEKLAQGDTGIQFYIQNNFEKIIRDTALYGYHKEYPQLRITITPPQ